MDVTPWDWSRAPDDELADYHRVAAAARAEVVPDDRPLPLPALLADLRAPHGHARVHRWVARDRGRIVGTVALSWEETGVNERLAELDAFLLAEARGRRLGQVLVEPAIEHARAVGRTTLAAGIADGGAGERFARSTGWRRFSTERYSRVATASLDRALLERWSTPVAGYETLVWEGPTPDHLVEDMAALRNAEGDAPWGTLPVEDQVFTPDLVRQADAAYVPGGRERWTVAARDRAGKGLAAYTQLLFWPGWEEHAFQDWTAVDRAHRGRGLAKWVKAVNARRLLAERPSVTHIDTTNNVENAPMLAVNVAMGFRPVFEFGSWSLELA